MSDSNNVERLTILGEELPVRISEEDQLARQALNLVQDKLDTVEENADSPSNLQRALLSSLNLAGDLVRERRESKDQNLSGDTTNRIRKLSERIDDLLAQD
jgi:cell division protein ZapA (FtsZ GTPase activity inhibitor)